MGTVVVAVRHRRLRHRLRVFAVDRHRSGTRRRTPTASPRRRSTTPTSASRSASRWASPPRRGWSRTGAARITTPATGAAIRAARRRAPTSTATGAAPRIRARARWYAGGGVAGTTASGSYYNSRTGTSGTYNAGPPVQRLDRQCLARLRPHGQHAPPAARPTSRAAATTTSTRASARPVRACRATGAGGSTYNRAGATTAGPEGYAHAGEGSTYNAQDGQDQHLGHRERRQQPLRRRQRQRLQNTGDGWQQHSSSGWSNASRRHVVGRPRVAGAQRW